MTHLTEEQLILLYYGEHDDTTAALAHRDQCDHCRNEYQQLETLLAAVDTAPVPERDETYGAAVWQQLRPELMEDVQATPVVIPIWRRWSAIAAAAAALVIAFSVGRFWQPESQLVLSPDGTVATTTDECIRERIIVVALSDHLERSQMMMLNLVHTEGDSIVDITATQLRASDLLTNNRLYRMTAARDGDQIVASFLDDLERMLMAITNADPAMPANELAGLQRRIAKKDILFKARVLESQIRGRECDDNSDSLRNAI
jgi:hypothetical protein